MNWYFWIVVLEKTLGSPLDCKELKPVKGNQPEYSLERLLLKMEASTLMWGVNSLKKTLILGKIEGKKEKGFAEDEVGR